MVIRRPVSSENIYISMGYIITHSLLMQVN